MKYRDEQLENYEGPQIEISASDYHHIPKPVVRRSSTRVSLQGASHRRRRSQFSIPSENIRRTSQNSRRPPSVADTDESYDPYRSSRHQVSNVPADYARVTVLRGVSDASRRLRAPHNAPSLRHPALARVQGEIKLSIPSSPPSLPLDSIHLSQLRSQECIRRIQSRSSLASSYRQRTSPAGIRASQSYKRGVSFNHAQKRSSSEPFQSPVVQQAPLPPTMHQRYLNDRLQQTSPNLTSLTTADSPHGPYPPHGPYSPVVRSRKEVPDLTHIQELTARKSKAASHYWKEEARKVSVELEKFCDEAFNRSSIASSTLTGTTVAVDRHDGRHVSSTTSLSSPADPGIFSPVIGSVEPVNENRKQSGLQRSLPKIPDRELIGSLSQIRLAKTRNILKQRATDPEAGLPPGSLDDVIAHLDRWMESSKEVQIQDYERRVSSAPGADLHNAASLSPIHEENGRDSWYTTLTSPGKVHKAYRAASEPNKKKPDSHERSPTRRGRIKKKPTIRIVDDLSRPISPIRPLVIRKRSGVSTPPTPSDETLQTPKSRECLPSPQTRTGKVPPSYAEDTFKSHMKPAHGEEWRPAGLDLLEKGLDPIEEDGQKEYLGSRAAKTLSWDGKRRWFRRHQPAQPSQVSDRGPTPPVKDARFVPSNEFQKEGKLKKGASDVASEESQRSEPKKGKSSAKGKLFKIFSKRDYKESKGSGDFVLSGEPFSRGRW